MLGKLGNGRSSADQVRMVTRNAVIDVTVGQIRPSLTQSLTQSLTHERTTE